MTYSICNYSKDRSMTDYFKYSRDNVCIATVEGCVDLNREEAKSSQRGGDKSHKSEQMSAMYRLQNTLQDLEPLGGSRYGLNRLVEPVITR